MDYKTKIDELKDDLINSVREIVQIPSVYCEPTDRYPFGENIDICLRKTLALCEKLGFKTYYDRYYGYAEIGTGDEMIGILGHLDVVPEGELESWTYPPFEGKVVDGKIYGRGTQDDKGPTIATLYAVKALLDTGITFNKRIRFIFGIDEENLWRSINKYLEKEEKPNYGFTPDSVFPLTNAEKGLLQFKLVSTASSDIVLKGGTAFNSVPDKITFSHENILNVIKELDNLGFEYNFSNNSLTVIGKGSHASTPWSGINAISRLCMALNRLTIESKSVKFIAEVIGEDYHGVNIFGDCQDDVSGKLSFNISKIEISDGREEISIDIRFPVTFSKDYIVESIIKKATEFGLEYKEFDDLPSLHVPINHFLIKTLQRVYEEETGLDSTPLSTGGATFARATPNCVSFGATFPGQEKVAHQADEYIDIENLIKCTKLYARAIYELSR